jgi:sugar lactone lactonase YvrE
VTTCARRWLLPAAAVVLVGCTTPGAGPTSPPATTIAGAGSGSPAGSRSIAGLKQPFGVATEKGDVWVTEYQAGNLVRIDGSSNRITRVHVGPHASHVVIQRGVAWVVDDLGSAVIGVDTEAARVVKEIPLRANAALRPNAIAAGDGSIWVTLGLSTENPPFASAPPSQLVGFVPGGNDELSTTRLAGVLAGVVVGGGAVWVASVLDPVTIYRIDPATKRIVASIDTGHPVSGALAYLDPDLWVANRDGYLTQIDARTNRIVGNFEVGSPEWPAVVAQGQAIWISAPLDNILARFDPATGTVSRTVRAGSRPQGFAFLGNDVWVANYIDGTVTKLPLN